MTRLPPGSHLFGGSHAAHHFAGTASRIGGGAVRADAGPDPAVQRKAMTDEDQSTHNMVAGLHRRLDGWDQWRADTDQRIAASDRMHADADKRMALMEQEQHNARESTTRMYGHLVESLGRIESEQRRSNDTFSDHDAKDQQVQRSTVAWLRTTFVVVALALSGMIFTLLSNGVTP